MTILIVATAIAALVALVAIAKVNPFLAFLAVSIGMAIALGVPPADVPPLVQKGLGSIFGGLTIVIAAGAMLGRLVVDSGVDKQIAAAFEGLALDPLLLAWLLTVAIRVCVGSATVAGLTAASILAPLVADPAQGVDPNLMVLAVGSGSLACSHGSCDACRSSLRPVRGFRDLRLRVLSPGDVRGPRHQHSDVRTGRALPCRQSDDAPRGGSLPFPRTSGRSPERRRRIANRASRREGRQEATA
jgi:H+/gluconate symporter-like permease